MAARLYLPRQTCFGHLESIATQHGQARPRRERDRLEHRRRKSRIAMLSRLNLLATGLLLLALGLVAPDGFAQERRVPSSATETRLSFAPVVQRAAPSVVNVYAARMVAN